LMSTRPRFRAGRKRDRRSAALDPQRASGLSCRPPCRPRRSQRDACQRQKTTLALEIHHLIVCFRREAAQRDVPVTRLIHDLLDVIVADGLTTAILGRWPLEGPVLSGGCDCKLPTALVRRPLGKSKRRPGISQGAPHTGSDGPARVRGIALSSWRGRYPNQNHVPFCGLLPDCPQLRAACLHHWPQRQSYHRCHACGWRVAVWRDYRADWCADLVTPRRFPPPWSAEETNASYIVRDANGQALAYVLFRGGARTVAKRQRRAWLPQRKVEEATILCCACGQESR
jgi:hypothetical protein